MSGREVIDGRMVYSVFIEGPKVTVTFVERDGKHRKVTARGTVTDRHIPPLKDMDRLEMAGMIR